MIYEIRVGFLAVIKKVQLKLDQKYMNHSYSASCNASVAASSMEHPPDVFSITAWPRRFFFADNPRGSYQLEMTEVIKSSSLINSSVREVCSTGRLWDVNLNPIIHGSVTYQVVKGQRNTGGTSSATQAESKADTNLGSTKGVVFPNAFLLIIDLLFINTQLWLLKEQITYSVRNAVFNNNPYDEVGIKINPKIIFMSGPSYILNVIGRERGEERRERGEERRGEEREERRGEERRGEERRGEREERRGEERRGEERRGEERRGEERRGEERRGEERRGEERRGEERRGERDNIFPVQNTAWGNKQPLK
ncbi:hypothetical protein DUI87_04670 [Hirundo rustica rustica]|uniref:Uncharacterized protein n=1 Tax=Hirundo rustica rustica TaxID=333673 RepID=A0A3M0L4G8_HIRRU|nr:hypothetical protein DUI87_04670 [Hirundo rustica rustica]